MEFGYFERYVLVWKPPCFVLQNELGVMQPTGIKDHASCTKEMAGNILQARVGAAAAVLPLFTVLVPMSSQNPDG